MNKTLYIILLLIIGPLAYSQKSVGDNLGNHTAILPLNMNGNYITNLLADPAGWTDATHPLNSLLILSGISIFQIPISTFQTRYLTNFVDLTSNQYNISGGKYFTQDIIVANASGGLTIGKGKGSILSNTAIGTYSLSNNSTGNNNTVVGYVAGAANTEGHDNTLLGYYAGNAITTGIVNTIVGSNSGKKIIDGNSNTLMGENLGTSITSGSFNSFLGTELGNSIIDGSYNTIIGYSSGVGITSGNYNNIIGNNSGTGITTLSSNTIVGNSSGTSITIGSNNTILGNLITGSGLTNNIVLADGKGNIGLQVKVNTNSTALGNGAITNTSNQMMFGNIAVTNNIFQGNLSVPTLTGTALLTSISTDNIVTIDATGNLHKSTTQLSAMYLPLSAGPSYPLTGSLNGTSAKFSSDITVNGVTVGIGAGTSQYNTSIGYTALSANTVGASNIAIGYESLLHNTTGNMNTAVGYGSLRNNVSGINNTTLGNASLFSNTTGYQNTAIGNVSLNANTTGHNNVSLGESSSKSNSTGTENISIGSYAFSANTTGINNVVIGSAALKDNVTGSGNIIIGYQAGSTELGSNKLYISNSNTTTPLIGGDFAAGTVTINGILSSTQYKLSALNTDPVNSNDPGTIGEIRVTPTYIYVCIAANKWARAKLDAAW